MDDIDLKILRKLFWQPFDEVDMARGIMGPWDIARELQVHGNTVKRRIQAMEDNGVLCGVELVPEPGLIGAQAHLFRFVFDDAAKKTTGMRHIASRPFSGETPGSLFTWTFVGNEGWAGLAGPATVDLDSVADELADQADATTCTPVVTLGWRTDDISLGDLDRRILIALHDDALRPLSIVAEEVGVTAKTVRTRLGRMARSRVFCLLAYTWFSRVDGVVPFLLTARIDPNAQQAGTVFQNAFPDAIYRGHADGEEAYLILGAETTEKIDAAVVKAQGLHGVQSARALLFQDSSPCPGLAAQISPTVRIMETPEIQLMA